MQATWTNGNTRLEFSLSENGGFFAHLLEKNEQGRFIPQATPIGVSQIGIIDALGRKMGLSAFNYIQQKAILSSIANREIAIVKGPGRVSLWMKTYFSMW